MQGDQQKDALNDALVDAVKAGSLDRVRGLLEAGADPSHWGKEWGATPLHYAAMLGFEEIAEALLAAGADPDKFDFKGVRPLVAATLAGHRETAHIIQTWLSRRRDERSRQQLKRLGWSAEPFGGRENEEAELFLAGTEKEKLDGPDRIDRIIELATATEPFQFDVPFTSFEGWIKQIAVESQSPIGLEALNAGFPWFLDLAVPPDKFLAAIPQSPEKAYRFTGKRIRRFAGPDDLPRSRYYPLCKDQSGNDTGTLVCELLAYSHIARSGKIDVIDMADPTSSERLSQVGLEPPASNSVLLVFRQGPKFGLNPFLIKMGALRPVVAFPLSVRVVHERIDKVVDLRVPDTADWLARLISQAVLEVHATSTNKTSYIKCWPFRPPLHHFGELLPTMLTQELGGGVLSVVAGALLRKAGADALIFPSARNDPYLRVRDGEPRRAEGWNLVDYRGAPPPKQIIAMDVDQSWPNSVRLGPGFDVRDRPPDLFKTVTIDYEDSGPRRGSFEVEGIVKVLALLRELELQSFLEDDQRASAHLGTTDEVRLPWFLL